MEISLLPSNKSSNIFLIGLLSLFVGSNVLPIYQTNLVMYAGEYILLLTLSVWFIAVLINKKTIYIDHSSKWLLLTAYFGCLSMINAQDFSRFIAGIMNYLEAGAILILVLNINWNEKKLRHAAIAFVISAIILSLRIIFKTYYLNNGDYVIGNKISLDLGGSNYLASLLLLPYFIVLTAVLRNKIRIVIIFVFISLVILGLAIIFTGSRAALLILGGLTLFYLISEIILGKSSGLKKVISLGSFISLIIVLYNLGANFLEQMIQMGRFQNLWEQQNAIARIRIYKDYIQAFLHHPFVGNGFFNIKSMDVFTLGHNYILQIFADGGIIAGVPFIVLISSIFKLLQGQISGSREFSIFLTGFKRGTYAVMIHGMFEPNFGTKLFMIYFFIGIGLIVSIKKFFLQGIR